MCNDDLLSFLFVRVVVVCNSNRGGSTSRRFTGDDGSSHGPIGHLLIGKDLSNDPPKGPIGFLLSPLNEIRSGIDDKVETALERSKGRCQQSQGKDSRSYRFWVAVITHFQEDSHQYPDETVQVGEKVVHGLFPKLLQSFFILLVQR